MTEALAQATGARRAAVWRIVESGDALACIDCFDSENEGHTQGTRLASKDHRVLIDALAHGETLRVTDAAADPRTAPLQRHYLTPLDAAHCSLYPSATVTVSMVRSGSRTGPHERNGRTRHSVS